MTNPQTTRLKYIGATDEQVKWGNNDDPRGRLIEGEFYEVADKEVRSFHTKISLVGHEGKFNSVCFEDSEDDGNN